MSYFLDTYAIIEFLRGNELLEQYFNQEGLRTSIFNIAELYYKILSDFGEQKADEKTLPFLSILEEPKPLTIKKAMKFRLANKKKGLSYADCIGYQIAKDNGIKFLTGDKEFEDLPNVEFVK